MKTRLYKELNSLWLNSNRPAYEDFHWCSSRPSPSLRQMVYGWTLHPNGTVLLESTRRATHRLKGSYVVAPSHLQNCTSLSLSPPSNKVSSEVAPLPQMCSRWLKMKWVCWQVWEEMMESSKSSHCCEAEEKTWSNGNRNLWVEQRQPEAAGKVGE